MSGSRTLLRKLANRPPHRRVLPGTRRRRVRDVSHWPAPAWLQPRPNDEPCTYAELGLEVDLHATKGYRARRA